MPKNTILKNFGRRKSAGNVLDSSASLDSTTSSSQSSFRVIERPTKNIQSFDTPDGRSLSRPSPARPFNSPLQALRGKSVDDLTSNLNRSVPSKGKHSAQDKLLKQNRGSAATTNSGSSGHYGSVSESPRLSSSSTLPSSVDAEQDEELYPVRKAPTAPMHQTATATDAPTSNFATRAVRALSFGSQKHKPVQTADRDAPPVPSLPSSRGSPERTHSRDRGMTASSYASTAVPTKADNFRLTNASFGEDDGFSEMFASISALDKLNQLSGSGPTPPPPTARSGPIDSEPMYPPRTHSRNDFRPTPIQTLSDGGRKFSWDGRNSEDDLVSASALESPNYPEDRAGNGIKPAFLANPKAGYSLVPERFSPGIDDNFKKEQVYGKQTPVNEENPWAKKVELRDTHEPKFSRPVLPSSRPSLPSQQANTGAADPARSRSTSVGSDDEPLFAGSRNATPRAAKASIGNGFHFESSPTGPASRAIKPSSQSRPSMAARRMTTAQFEMLQRRGDSSHEQSDEEPMPEEEFDEDEDDIARAKQATMQRRKQEANMSVYRQQMKKVTGGGPTDLPNTRQPNERVSGGLGGFHLGGIGGAPPPDSIRGKPADDDDEDIPLGVLQAHGFPGAGRPPTRTGENDLAHQRRTSGAGSVVGGGAGQGNLPPFARRLPADPYYGAGLVSPPMRESMAFGNGGGSVYGGSAQPVQQGGHPAGLVGIIAGEERAKAARRGSPNPNTGTFDAPPNMNPHMMGPQMGPQTYMPQGAPMLGMPQMPMMGGDPMQQQQQMQQFMAMQMQFMQQMMAMQQQSLSPQQPMMPGDFTSPGANRPMSIAPSFLSPNQPNSGRAMTMMNPPSPWDMQQHQSPRASQMPAGYSPSVNGLNISGYTPSIAPSERSNVGMPSRYRPVATNPDGSARSQSMTSSMTLQAFTHQQGAPEVQAPGAQDQNRQSTIRVVEKTKGAPVVKQRAVDPDDDEDEGWAEMSKKRTEKKFGWRRKEKKPTQQEQLSELYHTLE